MESGRYSASDPAPGASAVPEPVELEGFRIPLRLFAARRLGDWTAAEDVAQEVLRVGLEALNTGRIAARELLPGFLFQTAVNVCMHRSRSASREKRALQRFGTGHGEEDGEDSLSAVLSSEQRDRLRSALSELSTEERRILDLTYNQELRSEEIGRRIGSTAGAVRVRRYRAIRRLSEILGVTPPRDREFRR